MHSRNWLFDFGWRWRLVFYRVLFLYSVDRILVYSSHQVHFKSTSLLFGPEVQRQS